MSESEKTWKVVSHNALQKITTGNIHSSWSLLRNGNKVMQVEESLPYFISIKPGQEL